MTAPEITITVNEKSAVVPAGTTAGRLRDLIKPGADILLKEGYPSDPDTVLRNGDRMVLIRRGEIPDPEELESLMAARHTPAVHARLKNGVVGIAGLGGLGSTAAIALTRAGVGTLILADFDVVEPSNLNRQQYDIDHIGMLKTEAIQAILKRINPYLTVHVHPVMLTPSNIPEIFSDVQVLLECFDRPDQKAMLIESASNALPQTYIIAASGMAGFGDGNRIQTVRAGKRLFVSGDRETEAKPGCGLMAPRVGIAACHQANLAVSLLVSPEHAVL